MKRAEAVKIINLLKSYHKEPVCELNFTNNFELLVSVILSAQCTDKRVNEVTSRLFLKYKEPIDFVRADIKDIEREIYSLGFYKNKAKSLKEASHTLLEKFDGQVPDNQKDLQTLQGVGQKTANVVYSVGFNGAAIAVDTHVFRVSNRVGLANAKDVYKTEEQLKKLLPEDIWSISHHLLIHHGRYICKARRPLCEECIITNNCKKYKEGVSI